MLQLDIELTDDQRAAMAAIPATSWFTHVRYRNAHSPMHPDSALAENNRMKQSLVNEWVAAAVRGKRVLDLFSANGAFSVFAALSGATEVVGVEFSEERVACAKFIAGTVRTDCRIEFRLGDVYRLTDYFSEPFDVALCLGGLYHIADPAHVLRQIRAVTKERLILQTSQVLNSRGNWARFVVRRQDRTAEGMTSIRGGYGTWHCTPACIREWLLHGGFNVIEERQPPRGQRKRFPWYVARCETI
jgi:SAM-dependent methyltransferase